MESYEKSRVLDEEIYLRSGFGESANPQDMPDDVVGTRSAILCGALPQPCQIYHGGLHGMEAWNEW